jgi:hypothetical protein
MSDQDEILKIVKELNKSKNDLVKHMTIFIKESKEIVQKTTKEQQKAEDMLKMIREVEKYHSVNIPDIKLITTPVLKPEVKFAQVTKPFEAGKPIDLIFETKNIKTPFIYMVIGKEKTATDIFKIRTYDSRTAKVLLNNIKNVTAQNIKNQPAFKATDLVPGTYDIVVQIVERSAKKTAPVIIATDQITIVVEPSKTPNTTNNITIISPTAAHGPYTTQPIDIEFKVDGPYHITNPAKEYTYQVLIGDNTNKILFSKEETTKDTNIIIKNALNNLQNGQYVIQVITTDPITKQLIIPAPVQEMFTIQVGGNNNVPKLTIINPIAPNNKIKESSKIALEFKTNNFTMPYQYIVYARPVGQTGHSVKLQVPKTSDKEIVSLKLNHTLPSGKYELIILYKDAIMTKTLIEKTDIIIESQSPSTDAKFRVYVGNTEARDDNPLQLIDGHPVKITLKNENPNPLSYYNWKITYEDKWIISEVLPNKQDKNIVKGGEEINLIFYIHNDNYKVANYPIKGKVNIEAYNGKTGKTSKGGIEITFIHK